MVLSLFSEGAVFAATDFFLRCATCSCFVNFVAECFALLGLKELDFLGAIALLYEFSTVKCFDFLAAVSLFMIGTAQ